MQRYYLDVLASQERAGDLLQRSCMPMLSLEINCGILCVGGLVVIKRTVLSKPLMQPTQLYLSDDPEHMLALARTMAAIRLMLDTLAAEQQDAAHIGTSPQHWPGRPWPLCHGEYESWEVEKLGETNLYLLKPPSTAACSRSMAGGAAGVAQNAAGSKSPAGLAAGAPVQPMRLVAKFWKPHDDHALGDLVQQAWHMQGVAPEVVSTSCYHA